MLKQNATKRSHAAPSKRIGCRANFRASVMLMQKTKMLFKILATTMIAFAVIALGSVLYRLQKNKPIMREVFTNTQFSESWCSGRSDRSALARWAIAKNILWVSVTKGELHVSPHFPFSLMFLPEAFGLDHRIPGRNILDVRETSSSGLLGHRVRMKYQHATGDEEHLELWVKDIAALVRVLADLRVLRKASQPKQGP
jgi:hypothetical protein